MRVIHCVGGGINVAIVLPCLCAVGHQTEVRVAKTAETLDQPPDRNVGVRSASGKSAVISRTSKPLRATDVPRVMMVRLSTWLQSCLFALAREKGQKKKEEAQAQGRADRSLQKEIEDIRKVWASTFFDEDMFDERENKSSSIWDFDFGI